MPIPSFIVLHRCGLVSLRSGVFTGNLAPTLGTSYYVPAAVQGDVVHSFGMVLRPPNESPRPRIWP